MYLLNDLKSNLYSATFNRNVKSLGKLLCNLYAHYNECGNRKVALMKFYDEFLYQSKKR